MMHYTINYGHSEDELIQINLSFPISQDDFSFLQLPAWRPGRYELGNFAQNVFPLTIKDQKNQVLNFQKVTKDRWKVEHKPDTSWIFVSYQYACVIKNAGGTFKTPEKLIVTPVNCLIYAEHLLLKSCNISLNIPIDFQVVSTLKNGIASNYYILASSPLVCSKKIHIEPYVVNDIKFNIVFEGNLPKSSSLEKVRKDFKLFTESQLTLFHGFESEEYYFLILLFDEKHYHGVEHWDSTLIALGPAESFDNQDFYEDLLGISSHELFHYWNIMRIRPKELLPYNYTQEQYFETGYIAEGITTYYGDLMLKTSGVFDLDTFLRVFSETIQRHFSNSGRLVNSLAESSIDLWLDGYKAGIPGRKVSIYHKGAVIALILDLWIRKNTTNKKSLDDVVRLLWQENGKKRIGYTHLDYQKYIEQVSGLPADWYFETCVFGKEPLEELLHELLYHFGLRLVQNYIDNSIKWSLELIENSSEEQLGNLRGWLA